MSKRLSIALLLTFSSLFFTACQKEAVSPTSTEAPTNAVVQIVSVAEAHEQASNGVLMIDVRQPAELQSDGAYPTASNVPLNILSMDSLPTDKDAPIMFACRSGNRSGQAAKLAIEWGYTNVYNVAGGINAWKSSGLPLK